MPVPTDTRPPVAQRVLGEEVVISGISGTFPDSENVYQLRDNLFNNVNMMSVDDRRWKIDHPEIPQRCGKLYNINRFDASFFGVHYKQAQVMDPQCRLLLEKTYEAVADAGINPQLLKGQNTGVFIGVAYSESEKIWFYEKLQTSGLGLTGCSRAMLANRLSYWLGTHGPSYMLDSACSSGLYALEHAYRAVRDGYCDSAIVGASNLLLHPYLTLLFSRLGVLSREGNCRPFDRDADGYVRSEAVCVLFLQRARDAKRVYAKVVHAKTNSDGYKHEGLTYPSREMQTQLMEQVYEEIGIEPTALDFLEAHGTSTRVGDPEELNAVDHVFCRGRKTPLLIGSVKSSIGHTEPASGLCSVTKVVIAMETGVIPANLNFHNPREDVEGMLMGRLKVVSENLPWSGSLAGVNSFGFGGANAHVLLQWNEKEKVNGGAPADLIPRLVVASGRTEEAVDVILKDFESRPVDAEYVSLMHNLQSQEIVGHTYRGYTLLAQSDRRQRSIKFYPGRKRPVWFVFTGMGSQWTGMGKSLIKIPVFAAAINKCQQVLKPHGVDVMHIITSDDPSVFDDILNCFVGIAACQIGLVDIMRAAGIEPDGILGHSVGELGCSYMDGCFTAEQMLLAAYYRGRASVETELIKGLMAAVGLGAEDARKLCPHDIEVACHNGPEFCTLSGPAESMKKFVKELQERGVFAREVNCGNIAYHSSYISAAGPLLLKYLNEVIPHPKTRSSRWVCSSLPQSEWSTPAATHSSAEYHTNNLLNSVFFEEASQHIPHNAITIEIAPHGLLQAILKRSLNKGITNIALTHRGHPDCSEFLFTALGRLFELGLQPQLANLYPPVHYPVSRGTPMISPLIRWEHSEDWFVMTYAAQEKEKSGERTVAINLNEEDRKYLSGHVIDGRNLFPATAYLELVWESVAIMADQVCADMSVMFEDVRFHRSTSLPKEGYIEFVIMVQKGSGKFEVIEGGATVVSGTVQVPENISLERAALEPYEPCYSDEFLELSSHDIYKELRIRGYNYQGAFCGLVSLDSLGQMGKVHWSNNWVAFLDSVLQAHIFHTDTRGLFVPTGIQKLTIDVKRHATCLQEMGGVTEEQDVPVHIYRELNIIQSGGVEVRGLKARPINQRRNPSKPVLEKYALIPNTEPAHLDLHATLQVCTHIALENKPVTQMKVVELHKKGWTPLSPDVVPILADLPLLKANITILAKAGDLSETDLKVAEVKIDDHSLEDEQNCMLVIASNVMLHAELLQTAVNALADGACILAREKVGTESVLSNGFRLETVFEKTLKDEKLLLLRKGVTVENPVVIHVTGHKYDWLPEVQAAISSSSKQHIILVAQGEPLSGIVGLVNCIRREPGSDYVRCFFILDTSAPPFDVNLPLYSQQLNKDLVMNVYSGGQWGSYRHLPLDSCATVTTPHAWLNIMTPGDLSSFKWLEGNLDPERLQARPDEELVQIYYSALNFRNVVLATGKVAANFFGTDRLSQDSIKGMEFSGRDQRGHRVMGIVAQQALSSMVLVNRNLLWKVPNHWTLEDAATVPVVYATAYYALVMVGGMKKGESVLIHSGTGGVGQAAINICLHAGCTVYTTVGTKEKRDFIKRQYPQLTDNNIGNSRDTSFEQLIMTETNGRGVDLVLNSLSEEKLQASVRCLAPRGRFLEIGKYDLANNSPLGMEVFLKETSFHGVMLDELISDTSEILNILQDVVTEGISAGVVQPLPRTVFTDTETEQAFRYMAAGKHIGKVMLQIRPEEDSKVVVPVPRLMQAYPQYFCNPNYSYIIAGGLGGFGLELADWLVLRGARKLVLSSRNGVKTGYQSSRVKIWRSYGAKVVISLADITTESGVRALLSEANRLGQVDAIFNLAVVLRDAILENQTEAAFVTSAGPKAFATFHLDKLSRQMCPHLRHFVVFSSVSCGRGNAGQSNYGMSNSIMERICEARIRDGLPGLAVQWGAVGDVGLVAEMLEKQTDITIGGTLVQRIASCLEVLDVFMRQSCPIVASMIVAEKHLGSGGFTNAVECCSSILGIRDLKTISPNKTLAELGMDSMTAVEIKQTLEREFELYLTPQEIRILTFSRLEELGVNKQKTEEEKQSLDALSVDDDGPIEGLQLLLHVIGDKESATQPAVRLPSAAGAGTDVEDELKAGPILFMLPGVEGVACSLEPLARNLKYQTICLQPDNSTVGQTVQDMARSLLPHIHSRLAPRAPFRLLGYSFGALLAMELALELEAEGRKGHLYLVDGSPDFTKSMLLHVMGTDEEQFETNLIFFIYSLIVQHEATSEAHKELLQQTTSMSSWEEKLDNVISVLHMQTGDTQHYKAFFVSILARVKALIGYAWDATKTIRSHTTLLKSATVVKAEEDYGLSKICEKKVEVHVVVGSHVTLLDKKETAAIINRQITNSEVIKFKNSLNEEHFLQ